MKVSLLSFILPAVLLAQAAVTLERAIRKETLEGDVKGAISLYEKAASEAKSDRSLAARALLRLAEAHARLGDTSARKVYERILRDFADQPDAAQTARARLAATATAVRQPRVLWSGGRGESISSDSRYLAFTDWATGNIGLRDLSTGVSRLLTSSGGWTSSNGTASAARPVLSPDGATVAYAWSGRNVPQEIRLLPLNSTTNAAPRTVWTAPGPQQSLSPRNFTPDGAGLLCVLYERGETASLVMLNFASGSVRKIKTINAPFVGARLSPDGRWIVYNQVVAANQHDIFVSAADGSAETAIAPDPAMESEPHWSTDGSQVIFLSTRGGSPGIWSVPVRNGKPAGAPRLVRGNLPKAGLIGATRGGAFVYGLGHPDRFTLQTATLDAEANAGPPAVLPHRENPTAPAYSPDGKQLAYLTADAAGKLTPVIRNLASGQERAVPVSFPVGAYFYEGPRWFPDGKSVLLTGMRDGQVRDFHRVDIATGKSELLYSMPRNPGMSAFRLSPNGKSIYICRQSSPGQASNGIYRFDIGAVEPIALKHGGWPINIELSPDGAQLAFLESIRPGAESTISIMPAAGGPARILFRAPDWADGSRYNTMTWTPDGRHILFVRAGIEESIPSTLWRIPAAGGDPAQVGIALKARIKSPTIHPDGRRLTFATVEYGQMDVVAVDLNP
jgi:Tol biopolymer transport system component